MTMKDIKATLTGKKKKSKFTVEPPAKVQTPEIPITEIKPPSELFQETPEEPEAPKPLSEATRKVTEGSCRMFVSRIRALDKRYAFEKIPDRESDLKDFELALTEYCIIKGIIFPPELFLGLAGLAVVSPYAVIGYAMATGRQLVPKDQIPDGNAPKGTPPGAPPGVDEV